MLDAHDALASLPHRWHSSCARVHTHTPVYTSEALARVDPSLNASPGPSAYGSISTFGEYPDSRFRSSRGVAIGTQPRSYEQEAHARARIISPGPGEYGIVGGRALGSQVESHRHSAPTYSFSSADREATANVLPSRAHERVLRGRDSPSPGLYRTRGALGEQINSRKKTLPAYTFSASDRFHMDKAGARSLRVPMCARCGRALACLACTRVATPPFRLPSGVRTLRAPAAPAARLLLRG